MCSESQIRKTCKFVNASSQRRERFRLIQHDFPPEPASPTPILLLQDCRTRWNSTFLMLHRAQRLRAAINRFVQTWLKDDISAFALSPLEWKQLQYLIELTYPFYSFTVDLSEEEGPSVHRVFDIYNSLFDHLDDSIARLSRKRTPWKTQVCEALEQAAAKLREYYNKTYRTEGYVYAIAALLDPAKKLDAFSAESWKNDGTDWADKYERVLRKLFEHYQERYPDIQARATFAQQLTGIDRSINRINNRRRDLSEEVVSSGEIQEYLYSHGMFLMLSTCSILTLVKLRHCENLRYSGVLA
jgi:hypothetical protein